MSENVLSKEKDLLNIKDAVLFYKNNIDEFWNNEKYKWEAVDHFQKNWNIDAEDFRSMLEKCLERSENLLLGAMYFPKGMILKFAEINPEKVRKLFSKLFDESISLYERINSFRNGCEELLIQYQELNPNNTKAKSHYQDLRAICAYLSFMYPDNYYLYKSKMYTGFKKKFHYKESSKEENYELRRYDNYANLCNEIIYELNKDEDLVKAQKRLVEEAAYDFKDNNFHMLAQTIIYVNSSYDNSKNEDKNSMLIEDSDTVHYWMYSPGEGAFLWDDCYKNGIMAIGWDAIGDLKQYENKDELKLALKDNYNAESSYKNTAHITWQFVHDIKPGDIVFAKKGRQQIIGRGVVEGDYVFDDSRESHKNIRKIKWTHKGEWVHPDGFAAMKTLTDITSYTDYVAKLNSLFEEGIEDIEEKEIEYPIYDAEDFLKDVYMDEESYNSLVSLIQMKKNVILQGAPGVGKTYAAKRLAYSMMGVKDSSRVMMVQFHQSYSYEDFIMGFRPSEAGFELKKGAFYNFCKNAEVDGDNDYFFIIDEINRGNLSKIFGELFMLIENDKRGVELQLLYSGEKFSVPKNVYIIGMMNTADRSLAMLDYALRRRFAFFDIKPGFSSDGFKQYKASLNNDKFNKLINCVESLNDKISNDDSLGEGFCIGHSYFCNLNVVDDQTLSGIVEYELIPLLKEYWFDETEKVKEWADNLRSSIK